MKRCSCCKVDRELSDYSKDNHAPDGFKCYCKACASEKHRQWREKNHEKHIEQVMEWRRKNAEYHAQYVAHYYGKIEDFVPKQSEQHTTREAALARRKETVAAWTEKNRKEIAKKRREYQQKSEVKQRRNVLRAERRKKDVAYRLECVHRGRINTALKKQNTPKYFQSMDILGCSPHWFRVWLEMNFEPGMNWENYGFGHDKWNIDHYRPCDSFQLEDPKQLAECFHWSNQFPCWQPDNFKKHAKAPGPLSPERQAKILQFQDILSQSAA